jgi:hypothetical protein
VASAEADVGQQLRLVNWVDGFYTLDLDNHEVFDNQINAVTEIDPFPVLDYRQPHLLSDRMTLFAKFVRKAGFIRALEQARVEMRMNLHLPPKPQRR